MTGEVHPRQLKTKRISQASRSFRMAECLRTSARLTRACTRSYTNYRSPTESKISNTDEARGSMSTRSNAIVVVCFVACARALAAEPTIVHAGLECIAPGRFAVVLSGIDPESEVQAAKVYFRSALLSGFLLGDHETRSRSFRGHPSASSTRNPASDLLPRSDQRYL